MHATPPSRFRAPWLIVTLAALGVIALAVGVVHYAPASCAMPALAAAPPGTTAPPGDPALTTGVGVFYNPDRAEDRCSIEPLTPGGLYASLPAGQYRSGAECGAYLDITGPHGTVQAEIIDMCPGCTADQLDLSFAAFDRIQQQSQGTARISYQLARDPQLPAPLAVRVGPGSTAGSLAIQVLNHGNPLAGVQVNGRTLSLRSDGYWIAPEGAGVGPFDVRVSDVLGNDAVLTGITLRPGTLQQTGVPMYGAATASPPQPEPSPAPPPASPSVLAQRAPATNSPTC
jgi:hypothetical protein